MGSHMGKGLLWGFLLRVLYEGDLLWGSYTGCGLLWGFLMGSHIGRDSWGGGSMGRGGYVGRGSGGEGSPMGVSYGISWRGGVSKTSMGSYFGGGLP